MHDLYEQLVSYLRSAWRYRWHAAIVAWVIAICGWIGVAALPDRFQASARVYVDTQSILRPLLAGLAMQPNVNQIIDMMGKTLISRPNVERIIEMADLNPKLKTADQREAMITRLTKELTIKSTRSENFYTITFSDTDPQQAKRVVQSLLTIFVEGSLGDKKKDSQSARKFIDEQLRVYGERLTNAESAVTEFKRKNLGLMPGQGQNFYSRLGEAKAAVNQARLDLAEAEQGRDAMKRRLQEEPPPSLLEDRGTTVETAIPESAPVEPEARTELDGRILALQQKLDALRLTYTERHPDIIATQRMIDQLMDQKQIEREQKQREREQRQREKDQKLREAKPRKSSPVFTQSPDPLYQQYAISMAEFESTVASLKARVAEYERRLNEVKATANAIPQVEAEYTQLTRDYEVTKRNYDQLASRRETAQLTGEMESTPNVLDFRVIDPPQVLAQAEWPNRPLFMTLVFIAALGGGVGFAFLISQLRPTIIGERDLQEIAGLPIFGTIMMAWTAEQQRSQRNRLILLIVCLLSLLSMYAAVMVVPSVQRIPNLETIFRRA